MEIIHAIETPAGKIEIVIYADDSTIGVRFEKHNLKLIDLETWGFQGEIVLGYEEN